MSNTSLLTLQSNGTSNTGVFVDNSRFNNIITRNGNVTNGTFSPYGDNFSYQLSSATVAGPSTHSVYAGANEDFTFECWFNLSSTTSDNMLMGWNKASTFDYIDINPTGYNLNMNNTYSVTGSKTWSIGTWYHFAVSRNSGSVKVYIDGTLNATVPNSNSIGLGSVAFKIGDWYTTPNHYFNGYISNLRWVKGTGLYPNGCTPSTTPLTAVSGTTLLTCQSNRFIDNSPNNYTLTPASATIQKFSPFSTVTVPKYYSYNFSGSSSYITTPASTNNLIYFPAGTDFTMECWVYPTAAVTYQDIFGSYSGSSTGRWLLYTESNGLTPVWYQYPSLNGVFSAAMTLNTWNHIAVVRIGGTTKGYLNGVERLTSSATYDLDGGTASLYIGVGYTGRTMFNGYISNLRMVRGAGVYTGAFTPPTSPLTATQSSGTNITAITGTQTVLLTCQSNTVVDNSTNAYTLTPTSTVKPLPVSPFTPTANTGLTYSPTVFGGSMYFDGTGDSLISNASTVLSLGNSDFTIEFWEYNDDASDRYLFAIGDGWSVSTGVCLIHYQGAYALSGGGTPVTGLGSVKANQWNHIALSRYGGNINLYVNGIYVGQEYVSTNSLTENVLKLATASAGSWPNYKGYLADLRITKGVALYTSNFYPGSTPLTPIAYSNNRTDLANTAHASLLLSGTYTGIIDQTRTNNLETFGDAKVVQGVSPYSGSYYSNYFDGNGDFLTAPYNSAWSLSGDFTIEFWLYWTAHGSYGGIVGCADSNTSQGISAGWFLDFNSTSNNLQFEGQGGVSVVTTNTIPQNQWVHVAVVRSGPTITHYLNGTTNGSGSSSTTFDSTNQTLKVGVDRGSAAYLTGYISNLRIVKGTAIIPPAGGPTSPLTAVANTTLLTCQSNKFVDNSTNNFTITRNGDTKVATQNPFQVNSGQSYYFDGNGDYLYSPNTPNLQFGTGDYTIEYWVNPTSFVGTPVHIDFRTSNGASGGAIQIYTTTGGVITVYGGSSTATLLVTGPALKLGEWAHVSLVRQSGVGTTLYINGLRQGSTVVDSTTYGLGSLWLGATATAGGNFTTGYISDLRITKGVARYTSNNTTYLNSGSPYMTK